MEYLHIIVSKEKKVIHLSLLIIKKAEHLRPLVPPKFALWDAITLARSTQVGCKVSEV